VLKEVTLAAPALGLKPAIEGRPGEVSSGSDGRRQAETARGRQTPGVANAFVGAANICRRSGRPMGSAQRAGCRAEAIPAVIMESQNSPGPFGPGELAVLVSDQ